MRLLVLTNAFDPDRGGGAAVYSDMCFELASRGIDVTVVTPYPFYPEWTDKSGRNGLRVWRYEDRGVHVHRFGMVIPRDPRSILQRVLFEGSLSLSLLRAVPLAAQADVIMVYCPLGANLIAGALMRFLFRKPSWLNVQDVLADAASSTGYKAGFLVSQFRRFERWLYNRHGTWSTISPVMMEKLAPLRQKGQPLLFVPNWSDKALTDALAALPVRDQPGSPLRLLYAGNIGAKQGLLAFCQSLAASTADFRFDVFGDGGASASVRDWIAASGDRRFSFGPFLKVDDFARELKSSDLYVITEKDGINASFFPSKMVAGMTAGIPILAVCQAASPLGQEMAAAQPGFHLEWEALDRLPDVIAGVGTEEGRARWRQWQANALTRAAVYDRVQVIDSVQHALEALVVSSRH